MKNETVIEIYSERKAEIIERNGQSIDVSAMSTKVDYRSTTSYPILRASGIGKIFF